MEYRGSSNIQTGYTAPAKRDQRSSRVIVFLPALTETWKGRSRTYCGAVAGLLSYITAMTAGSPVLAP